MLAAELVATLSCVELEAETTAPVDGNGRWRPRLPNHDDVALNATDLLHSNQLEWHCIA